MTHWNILAAYEPAVVQVRAVVTSLLFLTRCSSSYLLAPTFQRPSQVLLFKLGYVERADLGIRISAETVAAAQQQSSTLFNRMVRWSGIRGVAGVSDAAPRSVLQVCVLGDNGVGKSSFVWNISGLRAPGNADLEFGFEYEKFNDAILVGGRRHRSSSGSGSFAEMTFTDAVSTAASERRGNSGLVEPFYLSVVAVPLDHAKVWLENNVSSCDVVVLMFQCAHAPSLETALRLEELLPQSTPRLFVGSKVDLVPSSSTYAAGSAATALNEEFSRKRAAVQSAHESILQKVTFHVQESNLPAVALITSSGSSSRSTDSSSEGVDRGIIDAYENVVRVLNNPAAGVPHSTPPAPAKGDWIKYLATSRPTLAWSASMIGIASISIVVVKYNKELRDWLRSFHERTFSMLVHAGRIFAAGN